MNVYRLRYFILFLVLTCFFGNSLAQEQTDTTFDISQIDTSLWKYLRADDRTKWQISEEDSLTAYKDYFLKGYNVYREVNKVFKNKRLSPQEKIEKSHPLLEEAKLSFEEAARLNPFTPNLKRALLTVYSSLVKVYGAKKLEMESYKVWFKLLNLQKEGKRKRGIYHNMGKIALSNKRYDFAIKNFNRAIDLIFEDDFAKIDTTLLFNSLYQRGLAEYFLNKGQLATNSLKYAYQIAPEKYKQKISGVLKSISWDDGNIESFELYKKAINLENEKDYEEAAKVYEKILQVVKTLKARRLIHFRLGRLEFYKLDRKEDGITRLWIQKNILLSIPDTSAEMDSTRQVFLNGGNGYADMCYSMAMNAYNKKGKKEAFAYFYELSTFENKHRPRAYYFLASLSRNNDKLCLNYCLKANKYWDELTEKDRENLAFIFYNAYRNRGEFDEAIEWYKKYRELKKS